MKIFLMYLHVENGVGVRQIQEALALLRSSDGGDDDDDGQTEGYHDNTEGRGKDRK